MCHIFLYKRTVFYTYNINIALPIKWPPFSLSVVSLMLLVCLRSKSALKRNLSGHRGKNFLLLKLFCTLPSRSHTFLFLYLCLLQSLQWPTALGAAKHYKCTRQSGTHYKGIKGESIDVISGQHEDGHKSLPALPFEKQSDAHYGW